MVTHAYDPYLPPKIAMEHNFQLHKSVDDLFTMCTHITTIVTSPRKPTIWLTRKELNLCPAKAQMELWLRQSLVNVPWRNCQ